MKKFLAKIWFPTLLVGLATFQSFGIDASRAINLPGLRDSIIFSRIEDTSSADVAVVDSSSAALDTVAVADTAIVQDTIVPRDTIRIPDSLEFKDPFFFKYYIAVKDSATRRQVRDSLMQIGDTLELMKLDSLYIKDSIEVAIAKELAYYNSLSRKDRKRYDYEKELPAKIAAMNRKMEVKDSLRAVKDSIISATPRILETFAVPDSMH